MSKKGSMRRNTEKPGLPAQRSSENSSPKQKQSSSDSLMQMLDIPTHLQDQPNRVITERVLIAVLEKESNAVEETKGLMEAERQHMEDTLRIQRDHNEKDPNQKERREAKIFGRYQYKYLMLVSTAGMIAMPFVNLATASFFGIIGMMVFAGVLLNGRDRTSDAEAMTDIIHALMKIFRKG